MTVAEAVRDLLLTMAPVTALVGTRVRVFRLRQSEPTFPVIRVQRIDENEPMQLRGSGGIKFARVQVDSIARDGDVYATARSLDAAVHGPGDGTGLCGFSGDVGGSPAFHVHSIRPAGLREDFDPDELQQFKVMRDYMIAFTEG